MVNLSTAQTTGIVSLGAVLSGVVIVLLLQNSYYCEPEDNVKECVRLSSSGLTCYYLTAPDVTKGDRCTNGKWEPLERSLDSSPDIQSPAEDYIKVRANGKEWNCQANDGFVNPYTRCNSGASEGYLGEFI